MSADDVWTKYAITTGQLAMEFGPTRVLTSITRMYTPSWMATSSWIFGGSVTADGSSTTAELMDVRVDLAKNDSTSIGSATAPHVS